MSSFLAKKRSFKFREWISCCNYNMCRIYASLYVKHVFGTSHSNEYVHIQKSAYTTSAQEEQAASIKCISPSRKSENVPRALSVEIYRGTHYARSVQAAAQIHRYM